MVRLVLILPLLLGGCGSLDLAMTNHDIRQDQDNLSDMQRVQIQQMIDERVREAGGNPTPRWDK